MKSWKAFAAAALIGAALAGQQQSVEAQVVLGAKLGATFSSLDVDPDDAEDTKRLTSFGGGGFLRFGFGGLSLQPELLALTKGAKFEDTGFSADFKLDYVEVPVFLRFGLGQGTTFTPYVMVGPSFSFEIGCEVSGEDSGVSIDVECDASGADIDDRKKFDLGLAGAVGFEFAAGPGNILVEGRYTHGFTDLAKEEDAKVRNRMFGIFAGYAVPLGTR